MKIIKYFNNELISYKNMTEQGSSGGKELKYVEKLPIYEIRPLKYQCTNEEFKYWLDIITKTYGQHGEITYETIPDLKTKEEIRALTINNLIIENGKKDLIISNMVRQINKLNIKLNQIGGDK